MEKEDGLKEGNIMDDYSYWKDAKPLTIEELEKIVKKYFKVIRSYVAPGTGIPTYIVQPLDMGSSKENDKEYEKNDLKENFNLLYDDLDEHNLYPFLRRHQQTVRFLRTQESSVSMGPQELILSLVPRKVEEPTSRKININAILLIATIGTIMGAAIFMLITDPYIIFFNNSAGYFYSMILGYAIAILGIIGIHELGHLIACRRHKIKSSYPYFIPFIPPLGTMGAVIVQKSPPRSKDELFDVGLTGPLFGFLITFIVTIIGYSLTLVFTNEQIFGVSGASIEQLSAIQFPDPLLFRIFDQFLLESIPYNVYITAPGGSMVYMLHIIAFAGWIGCFVTGLNLFPIGQLDGGHVSRAIFGEKYYRYISYIAFFGMFFINFLMAILILILSRFSFEHPGPLNDVSPLSTKRKIISISFFVVLFITIPLGSFWL
ncbi:MAG: site-2 protease family protein [Promethearchaeota archaeon]